MNPAFELTKAALDASVERLANASTGFNAVCGAMAIERSLQAPVIDFASPGRNFYLAYVTLPDFVRYAGLRDFPAMALWVAGFANEQRGNQQHTFHGYVDMSLALYLTLPNTQLPPDFEGGQPSLMLDAAVQTIGARPWSGFGGYECVNYNGVIGAVRGPIGVKEGEGMAQAWQLTYRLNITAN